MLNRRGYILGHILNRAESYLKADLRYFIGSGFWLTVGQVAGIVASFALSVAFANLVSKEVFGTYKYIQSAYGLIALFVLPGLATATTRSVSRSFDGTVLRSFKYKIYYSLIASVFSLGATVYYIVHDNPTLGIAFLIIAICLPLIEATNLYTTVLEGKKLFRTETILNIISTLILTLSLVAALYWSKNVIVLILTYFVVIALTRFICFLFTLKYYISNRETDPDMGEYARNLTWFQIFSSVTQYVDKLILFTLLGPAQVAIYTFAQAMPDRLKSLFRIIVPLSFPKYSIRTPEEIRHGFVKKILFLTGAAGLSILAYIILAPFIFHYLFPNYESSVILSQIIAVTGIFVITYPTSSLLTAHQKIRELFIISGTSTVLGLAVMLATVPTLGIWGAVIGLSVNRLATLILSFYFIYQIYFRPKANQVA